MNLYRNISCVQYLPHRERFFEKANVSTPDKCWEWQGSMYQNGYGKFGKRGIMAHRIAYVLVYGEVPQDKTLDHLCRNRCCVNPSHLEAVTHKENLRRGESPSAENLRKTHCPKGHEYTKTNTGPSGGGRRCLNCHRTREYARNHAHIEGKKVKDYC